MKGSFGSTGRYFFLSQSDDNFERGDTDMFSVYTQNVGRVHSIEIGHNNIGSDPGWFLDYVDIDQRVAAVNDTDIRPGTTKYRFNFFNWIASDKGDGLLVKTIYPNPPVVKIA
ncbi:lipoxygenase homology domain-containing protein 1-like [Physella acuta]|uniref:lipoxygenase homology domain-containing protein 1-like n=1 Tax=Physella acuta TaxID=109671 RepID=UPI0027DBAC7E|nr:lipoxygenase homology domain-containing protein 1-like [Physella acuta]